MAFDREGARGGARGREAAERVRATAPPPPALDPALRAQLRDVGPRLPELWASGRLTVIHKKELLRSLIRRVILTRPAADRIAIRIVWVSGAYSEVEARPPIWRTADLEGYEQLAARVRELSAAGQQDRAIARRLTDEGFHAARGDRVDAKVVGKIRRSLGQASLTEQCRRAAKVDGQWTVYGLGRELGVDRNWLYRRLYRGTLTASRHPTTGHYLIPDEPELLARLRAEVARNSHL